VLESVELHREVDELAIPGGLGADEQSGDGCRVASGRDRSGLRDGVRRCRSRQLQDC
jgi:hypothetical protein